MAVLEALSELAGAPLQRLHHKQDDGKRLFDSLAATCIRASAGRKATPGLTGIDLYFEVFDFAGRNHFGTWIVDYVAEVCGNSSLTSNDALEAQLLDGSFVKAWCHRTIQAMQERLLRSLSNESALESYSTKEVVLEISLTEVVISVLEALGSIRGAARSRGPSGGGAEEEAMADAQAHDSGGGGVADDLSRAARLRRTQSLVQWCGEHRLMSYPPTGAFASLSDWRACVKERQEGRRQLHTAPKTFLDGLLEALSLKGHYPFPSVLNALSALAAAAGRTGDRCGGDGPAAWCVAGSAEDATPDMQQWECCLALAVYYLTDMNVLHRHTQTGCQLVDSLTSSLHLHPAQLATWCAAPLLDDALATGAQDNGAVEQASRLLLSHAPPHLHISFLQVLSYLGHPNTALSLHRARDQGVSEQPHDIDTAWALTELRLRCGLVAEAFAMSRQYAAAQPDAASRHAVLSRLLSGVLDWCDAHAPRDQCSTTLLELCCGEEEEPVLVQWLLGRAQRQQAVGGLLAVALAARGCLPEAVAAQGRVMAMNAGADQLTAALVDSALQGLPVPLRDLTVDDDGGVGLALGATGLLPGLILDSDTHTPHMRVAMSGTIAPALTSTRVPALPPTWRSTTQQLPPEGPSRPDGLFPDTQGELQGRALLTGIPATGSAAMVGSLPARERLPLGAWTPAIGVSMQGMALQPPLGGGGVEAAGGSLFAGGPLPPVPPPLDWLAGSGRIVGNGSSGGGAGAGAAATPSRASLFSLSAYGAGAELLTGVTDVPTMKRARPNTWMQQ